MDLDFVRLILVDWQVPQFFSVAKNVFDHAI